MLLRRYLADAHFVELGFGTSDDGRCWVLVVQTNNSDGLSERIATVRSGRFVT